MGIRASFTVLPAESFARLQADPRAPVPRPEEHSDLEKPFDVFHQTFRDEKGPLRYVIQGDIANQPYEREDNPNDLSEVEEDGTYFAYVSPETVRAIAEALAGFPRWKMMERVRKLRPSL